MQPNMVREYVGVFTQVAADVMKEIHTSRGTNAETNEVPGLENLIFKWSTECKYVLLILRILGNST